MISILCTSRSGSTNLSNFISKSLDLPLVVSPFRGNTKSLSDLEPNKVYKLMIQQKPEIYEDLYVYGKEVIEKSDRVVLLDRKDKMEQSESLAFRIGKYGHDHTYYHKKEPYNDIDYELVMECYEHYSTHTMVINRLSKEYNIPVWLYEDVFFNKQSLRKLCDYMSVDIEDDLYHQYMTSKNKERVDFIDNVI